MLKEGIYYRILCQSVFCSRSVIRRWPKGNKSSAQKAGFPGSNASMMDDLQTFPFFMQILLFLDLRAWGFCANRIQFVENKHSEAHGMINMANTIHRTEIWSVNLSHKIIDMILKTQIVLNKNLLFSFMIANYRFL